MSGAKGKENCQPIRRECRISRLTLSLWALRALSHNSSPAVISSSSPAPSPLSLYSFLFSSPRGSTPVSCRRNWPKTHEGAKNSPTPKEANLPRTSTSSAKVIWTVDQLRGLYIRKTHTQLQWTCWSLLTSDSPEIWAFVALNPLNLSAILHWTCFRDIHFGAKNHFSPGKTFFLSYILTDVGNYENRPRLLKLAKAANNK